jgi:hypothetical protein
VRSFNGSEVPKAKTQKPLDAFVRVSRVGGRGGDSFISPDVPREKIEAYAKARGAQMLGVWFS